MSPTGRSITTNRATTMFQARTLTRLWKLWKNGWATKNPWMNRHPSFRVPRRNVSFLNLRRPTTMEKARNLADRIKPCAAMVVAVAPRNPAPKVFWEKENRKTARIRAKIPSPTMMTMGRLRICRPRKKWWFARVAAEECANWGAFNFSENSMDVFCEIYILFFYKFVLFSWMDGINEVNWLRFYYFYTFFSTCVKCSNFSLVFHAFSSMFFMVILFYIFGNKNLFYNVSWRWNLHLWTCFMFS